MTSYQIFLSHSGDQKPFADFLFHELKRANYTRVFFDQDTTDSLPKASELQETILGAVESCELGVVIISEAFITSRWPMLELQHLVAASPIGPSKPASVKKKKIYPIFFGLEPSDLTEPKNLARWQAEWDKMAAKKLQHTYNLRKKKRRTEEEPISGNLNISAWPKALQELRSRAGTTDVKVRPGQWRKSVDTIIREICHILPPPLFYNESLVQGKEGTAEIIEDRFTKIVKNNNSVGNTLILGVYGIAGGGKSTLCKTMTDYYNQYGFCGKSVWLQLPTNKDEDKLKEEVKRAIISLTRASDHTIKRIGNLTEAISTLRDRISCEHHYFLAIDNVWPWSQDYVYDLLLATTETTTCDGNNKIIVTGRSHELLTKVLKRIGGRIGGCWVVGSIPDIKKEDALKALLGYIGCCNTNKELYEPFLHDFLAIVDLCFFNNHYHPLVLKTMGKKLAQVDIFKDTDAWKELVNEVKLVAMRLKQQIFHKKVGDDEIGDDEIDNILVETALKLNYDLLGKDLKNIFLDVVNLWTYDVTELRHLYPDGKLKNMEMKILQIENFGLWSVQRSTRSGRSIERVDIHDLYKLLAQKEGTSRGNYLVVGGSHEIRPSSGGSLVTRLQINIDVPSDDGLIQKSKSILSEICFDKLEMLDVGANHIPMLQIPVMQKASRNEVLKLSGCMGAALRKLEISRIPSGINIIEGLSSAPNLRQLDLHFSDSCYLMNIKEIECLTELQDFTLLIQGSCHVNVPNLGGCSSLNNLTFLSTKLRCLAQLHLASHVLEKLDLSFNPNLVDINGDSNILGSMQALQTLRLSGCKKIKEFPNVTLKNLKILEMRECDGLELIMPGATSLSDQLPVLEELDLEFCHRLKVFPAIGSKSQLRVLLGCSKAVYLRLCEKNTTDLVPHLQHLEQLMITGLEEKQLSSDLETSSISRALSGLSKLKELDIRIQESTKPEIKDIMKNSNSLNFLFTCLSTCSLPSLTSLSLDGFSSVESLPELSPETIRIQELVLSTFSSLKSINMSSLPTTLESLTLEECPALEILELNSSHLPNFQSLKLFTCESVKTLPYLPSSIRNLEIHKGCSISLQNLQQSLMHRLEKLTSLWYYAPESEPQEYSKLDMSWLLNLEYLHLYSCSSLESLDRVAGLTSLSWIDLVDCSSLGILPSLSSLTRLSWLNLDRCSSLDEVPDLSSNTRLKHLYLSGCDSLKQLPKLPEVNHRLEVTLSPSQMETLSNNVLSIKKLSFVNIKIS